MVQEIDYSPLKDKFKVMIVELVRDVSANVDEADEWADTLADDMARASSGLIRSNSEGNTAEAEIYQGNLESLEAEVEGRVEELRFNVASDIVSTVKKGVKESIKFGIKTVISLALSGGL